MQLRLFSQLSKLVAVASHHPKIKVLFAGFISFAAITVSASRLTGVVNKWFSVRCAKNLGVLSFKLTTVIVEYKYLNRPSYTKLTLKLCEVQRGWCLKRTKNGKKTKTQNLKRKNGETRKKIQISNGFLL